MVHTVDGMEYRTKFSTLRGDYRQGGWLDGQSPAPCGKKLDFKPQPDDIFQERLYAIQWMRPKARQGRGLRVPRGNSRRTLARERVVEDFVPNTWPNGRNRAGFLTCGSSRERKPMSQSVPGVGRTGTTFSTREQLLVAGLVKQF